jgi:hypothetical protein
MARLHQVGEWVVRFMFMTRDDGHGCVTDVCILLHYKGSSWHINMHKHVCSICLAIYVWFLNVTAEWNVNYRKTG